MIRNSFARCGFYDYQQVKEGLVPEECLVVAADWSHAVGEQEEDSSTFMDFVQGNGYFKCHD